MKLKTFAVSLLVALGLGLSFGVPVLAATSSNPLDATCEAASNASPLCASKPSGDTNPVGGPQGILGKIVHLMLIAAGIAAVIAILIGGFEYIISNGDSAKIGSAKSTILYAVIGLIIAITAESILRFVIRRF